MASKSEILSAAKSTLNPKDYWKILYKTGEFVACVNSKINDGKSLKVAVKECASKVL